MEPFFKGVWRNRSLFTVSVKSDMRPVERVCSVGWKDALQVDRNKCIVLDLMLNLQGVTDDSEFVVTVL